jgi:LmbE family N-acetylglucosaminyl deacetylase
MRKLMAIFAHPDDEGAIAGTLAHYARQGVDVTLVCATKGEAGEISDSSLATPETLAEVRQKELETACELLGITHLQFLGWRDSGMEGTPENEDPRALVQADPNEVMGKLVGLMRQYKPDVVITFEPFGWYGHPDHQVVSRWATAAYEQVGDATAHPESGKVWQPQRLFHAVIPFSKFRGMIETAVAAGYLDGEGFDMDIPEEQQLKTETAVTHLVDVYNMFDTKQAAMMAHRTQFGEDNMFRKIPKELMMTVSGNEHFIQVTPKLLESLSKNRLTDLFAGL